MVDLSVCIGSSCHLKGSYNVIQAFQQMIEQERLTDEINMQAQFCMKNCQYGVSVMLEGETYSVSPETAKKFFIDEVSPRIKK